MQRIILDTNVLVSALIQKNYPYLIVNQILLGSKFELCVSDALLREYYEVLNRRKFSKYPNFVFLAEVLLASIESKSVSFQPKINLEIINDLADNRLLELAVESHADFLITGNTNDFKMREYANTRIISPKDYYEKCCPH